MKIRVKLKVVHQASVSPIKYDQINEHQLITEIVFQGDVLVAQAAAFFTAGYETSSSAMSFALYELCWKVIMSPDTKLIYFLINLCNLSKKFRSDSETRLRKLLSNRMVI